MMNKLRVFFETVKNTFSDIKFIIFNYLMAIIFYIFLITQQLSNGFDAMWNGYFNTAADWEVGLGRWMLPYLDRLHLAMHTEPLVSCIVLAFFVAMTVLIIDMFEVKGILAYLMSVYIMTGSFVTCILSYRYTSIAYAFAAFMSAASVWFITKQKLGKIRYFLGILSLTLSLGAYQAYIGVTAVLTVFVFIHMLINRNEKIQKSFYFILEEALVIIIGCIIYRIIAIIHIEALDIKLDSYMGADNISLAGMILALPQSIIKCYTSFFEYFLEADVFRFNLFQHFALFRYGFISFMGLIIAFKIYKNLKNHGYLSSILIIAALLLVPVAGCFSLLLAPEANLQLQMTLPLAILFPCVISLMAREIRPGVMADLLYSNLTSDRIRFFVRGGVILCSTFFVYGNAWQSNRDIIAMYEGRNATQRLMEHVIDELIHEGLLSNDREYAFIGRPADNDTLFRTTDLYIRTNAFARYGEFWYPADSMGKSYQGVFRDISVKIPLVSYDAYNTIRNLDEVKSMPEFPTEGSIKEIDGYVVVKVGD